MEYVITLLLSILIVQNLVKAFKKPTKLVTGSVPIQQSQPSIDLAPTENRLRELIDKIPERVTNSITGTANTHKGKIGELIGYIQLKSDYDRIIPIGNITDFVGIKFTTCDEQGVGQPGYIHFIDIKTGKQAKLNPDQKKFKDLLDSKSISFKVIKIDDVEV
jgi:predicted Holliday junction resolvase-like endonuclease